MGEITLDWIAGMVIEGLRARGAEVVEADERESLRVWLAAHDAEVKAEALREAAVATNRPASGAPYQVWAWCSDWLRERADRIEREARP